MIRALYSASSELVAQSIKQDVIANNIANTQTAGFKRLRVTCASFSDNLSAEMMPRIPQVRCRLLPRSEAYPRICSRGSRIDVIEELDTSYGPIESTGNELDFAIEGPGEFEVISSTGKRYTRAGKFHVGPNGEILTADGAQVQGRSGPIRVPKGKIEVRNDGTIFVDGSEVDQLKILGSEANQTRVLQGCMEGSNVNPVSEMVAMIGNVRAFEASQKVIQSVDQTLDKLINEAGKV